MPAQPKISDVLNSGERILIRRALDMYIANFRAEAIKHKNDPYELTHDTAAIGAAGELSERIRLNK